MVLFTTLVLGGLTRSLLTSLGIGRPARSLHRDRRRDLTGRSREVELHAVATDEAEGGVHGGREIAVDEDVPSDVATARLKGSGAAGPSHAHAGRPTLGASWRQSWSRLDEQTLQVWSRSRLTYDLGEFYIGRRALSTCSRSSVGPPRLAAAGSRAFLRTRTTTTHALR